MYKQMLGKVIDGIINENGEQAQVALKEYMSLKTRQILEAECEDEEVDVEENCEDSTTKKRKTEAE